MTAHKVWLSPPEDGQECERPPSSTSPYFELKSSLKQQVVFCLYLIKGSNGFVQFTKNIFVVAADHISYTSPHVPLLISVFFPLKEHASSNKLIDFWFCVQPDVMCELLIHIAQNVVYGIPVTQEYQI